MSLFAQDSTRRAKLKDTVSLKIDSLKPAIVTAPLRPHIKGDTIEYATGSIRLRPYANVEQLLGRLPGLQIDNDGTITFNGEKIQHLLVDGEDLFGNNPALVTRNFDASKIARIQILDRKSEYARFSGIDDGSRTKTLNLILKDSARNSYFGKLEAGAAPDGYYNGDAVLAGFRGKEQFTGIGLVANTGVLSVAGGSGAGAAGLTFQAGGADPLGASAGTGIPRIAGTALHYANTWEVNREHLVTNYQYSHYETEPVTTTQTVQTLSDSIYRQYQQSQSRNQQDQHWLDGIFDFNPGHKTGLQIHFHGGTLQERNEYGARGSSSFNNVPINGSVRSISDQVRQRNFSGDLYWRTDLGKPGRNLTVNVGMNSSNSRTDGYIYSVNSFFRPDGTVGNVDTIDQRKRIADAPFVLKGGLAGTEPLWKNAQLGAIYNLSRQTDDDLQYTYDRGTGKYQVLVDSLSTQFKSQTISQQGNVVLQEQLHKLLYVLGIDWNDYRYQQKDLLSGKVLRQTYSTLSPKLIVIYYLSSQSSVRLFYRTQTQEPSISQLQPAKNNSDPLRLILGNPDLKPTLKRSIVMDYGQEKTWRVFVSGIYTVISKSISMRTFIDSLGRQVSESVNVDGDRLGVLNMSLSRRIRSVDLSLYYSGSVSRNFNYVNTILNRNNSYQTGGGIGLTKAVPEKFIIQLNTRFYYFTQRSSVNSSSPVHYWTQNHSGSLTLYLWRNYTFATDALYTWQQQASAFAGNNSVLLWNGSLGRDFLQHRLAIKVQFNNTLDYKSGITRTNVNNINTENSTNILGRYWLLTATWHFDRSFRKPVPSAGQIN